eukprot:12936804-Prorocentrum_lima.AAC.1
MMDGSWVGVSDPGKRIEEERIETNKGVRQGDPIAGACFCSYLDLLTEKVKGEEKKEEEKE